MNARTLLAAGWMMALACTAPALGAIRFGAAPADYTLLPGQQAVVPLYLIFDGPDRDRPLTEGGVLSAAIALELTPPSPVAPVLISGLAGNAAAFDDPFFPPLAAWNAAGTSASLAVASVNGAVGTDDGAARWVPLGTATFDAPLEAGTTTWRLFDNPIFDDTFLGNAFIDAQMGEGFITFTVVPTPSAALTVLPGIFLLLRRRR